MDVRNATTTHKRKADSKDELPPFTIKNTRFLLIKLNNAPDLSDSKLAKPTSGMHASFEHLAVSSQEIEVNFEEHSNFSRIHILNAAIVPQSEESSTYWSYYIDMKYSTGASAYVASDDASIDINHPPPKRQKSTSTTTPTRAIPCPIQVDITAKHMTYNQATKRSTCLEEFKGNLFLNSERTQSTQPQQSSSHISINVPTGSATLAAVHGIHKLSTSAVASANNDDNHQYCFGPGGCIK